MADAASYDQHIRMIFDIIFYCICMDAACNRNLCFFGCSTHDLQIVQRRSSDCLLICAGMNSESMDTDLFQFCNSFFHVFHTDHINNDFFTVFFCCLFASLDRQIIGYAKYCNIIRTCFQRFFCFIITGIHDFHVSQYLFVREMLFHSPDSLHSIFVYKRCSNLNNINIISDLFYQFQSTFQSNIIQCNL